MHWKSRSDVPFAAMKLPAGSFSWSISRRKLFDFCKRAYFYHYYGSAGGWDAYAPEPQKQIYRLKNIRRAEDWAVELFNTALRNLVQDGWSGKSFDPAVTAQALHREINRLYRHGCFDVLAENWRNDAKAVNLFEIYYERKPGQEERVLEYVRQRIAQLCGHFIHHQLFSVIGGLGKLQLRNCQPPLSFMLGDLEVWLAPTLIWRDEDRLKILVIRGGAPPDKHLVAVYAGMCQLMAEQLYHCPADKVDVVYYYTGAVNQTPEMLLVEQPVDPAVVIASVSADTHEMLSRIMPGDFVREKDFPGWLAASDTICGGCRFRELCRQEQLPG